MFASGESIFDSPEVSYHDCLTYNAEDVTIIVQEKYGWRNPLGYTDFYKTAGSYPLKEQNVIPTFLPKAVGTVGLF